MAIAVFPVCLSPIISSLWPLPIGIMESIALIPVCSGSFTDFLWSTPGAGDSIGLRASATIGPLPSRGCPSAFTTLPIIASPTGTSTTAPVGLTMSPSLISLSEPRITTPTLSSSRFWAIPYVSSPNWSSSPAMQFSRPYTLAIPSPT